MKLFDRNETDNLSEDEINALKMFDSNGPIPFLQEGVLQDVVMLHICDVISAIAENDTIAEPCKEVVPNFIGLVPIPFGNANGPGNEKECKSMSTAKYCHNYISPFFEAPDNFADPRMESNLEETGFNTQNHKFTVQNKNFDLLKSISIKSARKMLPDDEEDLDDFGFDTTDLVDLGEILINRNSYMRKVHDSLVEVLKKLRKEEEEIGGVTISIPKMAASLLMILWYGLNFGQGPGNIGVTPPFPYYGGCYPVQCTKADIETNNLIFSNQIFKHLGAFNISILLGASPNIPDDMATLFGVDDKFREAIQESAVGCSDDARYSGDWKWENYLVVSILAVIASLVAIGTLIEIMEIEESSSKEEKKKHGLGHKLITSFSLLSNIKFIFQPSTSAKKGVDRLDCLEGMRAMSMTWVILGHNFGFGNGYLHGRNAQFVADLSTEKSGIYMT